MSKKRKQSIPVQAPVPCWFFVDRFGHRFGPYTDVGEIRGVLKNHRITKTFEHAGYDMNTCIPRMETEFIMEDGEYNPVCPQEWYDAERKKRRAISVAACNRHHGYHVYRNGPVAGVHKSQCFKMWRTPSFGRKVRDTGHGCAEDGEPPIRVKCQVHDYCWDEFPPNRCWKNWKKYRDHQWLGGRN